MLKLISHFRRLMSFGSRDDSFLHLILRGAIASGYAA